MFCFKVYCVNIILLGVTLLAPINAESPVIFCYLSSGANYRNGEGGWNDGSTKYSLMASNQNSRATFIQNVIAFLSVYGFDGLDLDWEYPANRGGAPEDKENFVALLKELRAEFDKKGFLLTIAASADKNTMDTAYDVKGISKYVDYINVMSYDFDASSETFTRLNAPLYKSVDEPERIQVLNVDYAVQYWLDHGAPPSKLVLGIGLFGSSFTLKDAKKHGIYDDVTGKGAPGPITMEEGMLGYNEGKQWVGYDNEKSIKLKIDYLKQNQLAGAMVWSLDTDDFKGICGRGKYPLLKTIENSLGVAAYSQPSCAPSFENVKMTFNNFSI